VVPTDVREVQGVELPARTRERTGDEESQRRGAGNIDANELSADGVLSNGANSATKPGSL
jgi:hypothetical protein